MGSFIPVCSACRAQASDQARYLRVHIGSHASVLHLRAHDMRVRLHNLRAIASASYLDPINS